MTTLQKTDGSLTSDLNETVKIMIEYAIPIDEHRRTDDTDYHKIIRAQSKETILTTVDRDCATAEFKNAINVFKYKKAPEEDRITADIYQRAYE